MQRTYWIRYETLDGIKFDKVVFRSKETRLSWHKVEALDKWKKLHKGYWYLRINSVFTKQEMKEQGYM